MLFDEQTIDNLQTFSGGDHYFAKQLASNKGEKLRLFLSTYCEKAPESIAVRWKEMIHSLDNQFFFQAIAEITTFSFLLQAGWKATKLSWPKPTLAVTSPSGMEYQLLCISFLQSRRLKKERELVSRLSNALNKIKSNHKIGVVIRTPLTEPFNVEPICTAVELWLQTPPNRVGVFAHYKKDNIWLEFAVTGFKHGSEDIVHFIQGPILGQEMISNLQSVTFNELETLEAELGKSIILSWVSDQNFGISQNRMRNFLYGPTKLVHGPATFEGRTHHCDAMKTSGFFQNPLNHNISGILRIERPNPNLPAKFKIQSYTNPWVALPESNMPYPCVKINQMEGMNPIMGWVKKK